MIACDIDGTLLDYNYDGPRAKANVRVIQRLPRRIALVTNQGGTPFGVQDIRRPDGRLYPHPADFVARLRYLHETLGEYGVQVAALRISLYHPRAPRRDIRRASNIIRDELYGFPPVADRVIYTTARARKPSPWMLNSVGATEYWGDSDEDLEAARAAGISFVRATRFYG